MKWYHYLILTLAALACFGAGWFAYWFAHPLNCPMCLCDPARLAIDPQYQSFWAVWGWRLLAAFGALVAAGISVPLYALAFRRR